eukprot:SAG31_NODE_37288_length_305_cov_1.252427_1_plen_47_part_01
MFVLRGLRVHVCASAAPRAEAANAKSEGRDARGSENGEPFGLGWFIS